MKQARDIGVATIARELRPLIGDWGFGAVIEALAHIADEYADDSVPEEREDYDTFVDVLRGIDTP